MLGDGKRPDELTDEERGIGLEALARMSPSQSAVLELAREGLTQREIAARLGISQGAVSKKLASASKTLKATREQLLKRRSNGIYNP